MILVLMVLVMACQLEVVSKMDILFSYDLVNNIYFQQCQCLHDTQMREMRRETVSFSISEEIIFWEYEHLYNQIKR